MTDARSETSGGAPRGGGRPEPSTTGVLDLRDAFYVLALVALVVLVLHQTAQQLVPIVLAVLIWFLINAIANGVCQLPVLRAILPQWLSVILAAVATLAAAVFGASLAVENIAELGEGLGEPIRGAILALETWILDAFGVSLGLDVENWLKDLKFQDLEKPIRSVTSIAGDFTIILLFVVFLILDQPYFEAKLKALAPDPDRYDRVRAVLQKIGRDIRVYIWIMTLISAVIGVATYFIADYFGVRGAAFWGFLAFALNFIPTIGTFLGVIFPAVFALAELEPVTALGFAASLGVVQFVMGNLVLPRLTGDWLNLSEFVVIASLTIWYAIWGVAGMFLAVPMMMVFMIVLSQFDSTRPAAILLSKTGNIARR
ncbi:MAG: AI-2E family transporter [Pseudomonadota bacterium]